MNEQEMEGSGRDKIKLMQHVAVFIAELQRPVKECKGALSLMRGKENGFPNSPSFNLRLVGWLRRLVGGLGGVIPVTRVSMAGR